MKTAGEESVGGGNKVQKQIKAGINERDGVPSFQMFSSPRLGRLSGCFFMRKAATRKTNKRGVSGAAGVSVGAA